MVRTSIVLAVVAAALAGYILVFERGSVTSGEREQRKGNALGEFVRARVEKLEIQRKNVTTVLVRDPEADVEDDAALWRVQAPYRAQADQDAVETLLGELEWLDGRRRLEGITAEDRKRFGLENPRYRLWFTIGDTRVPVRVGNPSPRGDGVYLSAGDETVAFVVGKELIEALDHEPGDYHTKELHDGVLMATTIGVTLRDTAGERAVRKGDDGLWRFERAAAGLASVPAITAVVDALDALRARRFVAQNVKDPARYGLDRPRVELLVTTTTLEHAPKGSKAKPKRTQSTLRLRVGAACEGHAGESYVATGDASTVHCAADEELHKLTKTADELREPRLLPIEEGDVWDVQVARGDLRLVLTRSEERWTYELTRAGKVVAKGDARAESAPDWLKSLRAAQATRYDVPTVTDAASGVLSARFGRGKDKPPLTLRVLTAGPSEILVRRADEPSAVAFSASALELLTPRAAPFRPLALVSRGGATLQRLEIRRGAVTEQLARTDSGLRVQAPVQVPADALATSELTRLLGSLEAVRFVSDEAEPQHGLSSPSLVVTAEFAAGAPASKPDGGDAPAPDRLTLRLGQATEGGRFATLDGTPGVFVASTQLHDLLAAPIADRNLLATPLERLRAVELRQGARRVRVQRAGDRFEAESGAAFGGSPQALAEAVATLRATRAVDYGPSRQEHGFGRPFATLEVVADGEGGEQRYTIAIGAEVDGGRYARRNDQPVTFIVPRSAVDALLAPPAT